MTDAAPPADTPTGAAPQDGQPQQGQAAGPGFRILAQYVKDLSFENPRAPESLRIDGKPGIDLGVEMAAQGRPDGLFELELKLSVKAAHEDKPVFHVELVYGGLFQLANVQERDIEPLLLIKVAVAGVAFGLAGLLFAEANHILGGWCKRAISFGPLRPVAGGLAVIALAYLCGTRDYLGLGVWSADPHGLTIASFFGPDVYPWSWALKILFTVVTLSAGFKGGEVTPLFFIGAALGNALAGALGAPVDLMAGLGFVAVFAGAANTPLACTLMGIELFGATHGVYIAVACFLAYICSGHSGIYLSQRIAVPKVAVNGAVIHGATLRHVRTIRAARTPPSLVVSPPQNETEESCPIPTT